MTGLVAGEGADQAVPEQVQIADRIENLVLDELVVVAQPVLVEHAVIVEHDRVVLAAAEREVVRAQVLDVFLETEGTRATHFLDKRCGGKVDHAGLLLLGKQRMIEIDFETDLEAVERREFDPLVAILDADLLFDLDEFFRRVLLDDTGRLDQKYERSRAAIHNRNLFRAEIDVSVIDAETGNGRQQVFDCRDSNTVLDQRGRQIGIAPDEPGSRPARRGRYGENECPNRSGPVVMSDKLFSLCANRRPWRGLHFSTCAV